jgi:hypothetical protein
MFRITLFFLIITLVQVGAEEKIAIALPVTKKAGRSSQTRDTLLYFLSLMQPGSTQLRVKDTDTLVYVSDPVDFPEASALLKSLEAEKNPMVVYAKIKKEIANLELKKPASYSRISPTIPGTLQAFQKQYDFSKWKELLIEKSLIKGLARRLHCREEKNVKISVAETIDKKGGVRETEVIVRRTDGSGHSDFFVYDENGKRSSSSRFASRGGNVVPGSAPVACVACHYNASKRLFQNYPSSFAALPSIEYEYICTP